MPLTNAQIRNAPKRDKPFRMSDGGDLYLLIPVKGRARWRYDYKFAGSRKTLSLGVFPDISIKEARLRLHEAKAAIGRGIDPGALKRAERKRMAHIVHGGGEGLTADSFEAVAREYAVRQKPKWTEAHYQRFIRRLEKDVFPWIGNYHISALTAPMLLDALRRVECRNAIDTAHRLRGYAGQILRYAVATGRSDRDVSQDLRGALTARVVTHRATITDPKGIGALMRSIAVYDGGMPVRCALQFAAYTFARPGEVRRAEWNQIDLDDRMWRIPPERMKPCRPHWVPLSDQSVAVLDEIMPLSGNGRLVFPSLLGRDKTLSENTLNAALRYMGYDKNTMTSHGLRGMASTRLHESGLCHHDLIELQLAHQVGNETARAYNHAQRLEERRHMMQWWADYLDQLKER